MTKLCVLPVVEVSPHPRRDEREGWVSGNQADLDLKWWGRSCPFYPANVLSNLAGQVDQGDLPVCSHQAESDCWL